MDIGYTDLADEVMDQSLDHIDTILGLVEQNENAPESRQFRWTCESALIVQNYLQFRPKRCRERLLNALRKEWIELQAFLTQPLTETARLEDLIQCVGYAAQLGKKENFAVESAMVCDIAGYAGRLPSVLSGFGVKYLVAGAGGFMVHLPWAELPHLFYLEDKSGARLLTWNLGVDQGISPRDMKWLHAVYGSGYVYLVWPYYRKLMQKVARGTNPDAEHERAEAIDARSEFTKLEERLKNETYPFEEIMLEYGGDNAGANKDLAELIGRINDTGELPQIHLTTPRHFFRFMEKKYGSKIPVVKGVMADPWTIRTNAAPSGLKKFRKAQRALTASQARLALQQGITAEKQDEIDVSDIHKNLHYYTDHTYGLSEWAWETQFDAEHGCRNKAFDRYRKAWATKHFYAESALRQTEHLERLSCELIRAEVNCSKASLLIWNDLPESMSAPAEVYLGRDSFEITDLTDAATGKEVPFQCIGRNKYLILAPEVPALGYRRLDAAFGSEPAVYDKEGGEVVEEMQNEFLKVSFDPDSGKVTSVIDKVTGAEHLDCKSDLALGDFIYHNVEGVSFGFEQAGMSRDWKQESIPAQTDKVFGNLSGPIAQSVVIESHIDSPAGTIRIRREIMLYNYAPRIDIRVRIDKGETEKKECCYIAFPFAGNDGTFGYDQNAGWVEPAKDLIAAAMQDAFYCNSCVNINRPGKGIVVACPDAPVMQFGKIRTGLWDDELPFRTDSNHLYAWLYNNLLNTDVPIWQDVLEEFRFGIVFDSSEEFTTAKAMRTAAQISQPLRGQLIVPNPGGSIKESALSLLEVNYDEVRLLSIRRTGSEDVSIRLEEISGKAIRTHIKFGFDVKEAWTVDFFGKTIDKATIVNGRTVEVQLQPYAIETLRVKI